MITPVASPTRFNAQLTEWYIFDLTIVATSAAEAIKKMEAFYVRYRKPKARYLQEGITAVRRHRSVSHIWYKDGLVSTLPNQTTYSVQLWHWDFYDINVVVRTRVEALEKLYAFYVQHRKPKRRYEQKGLTVVLLRRKVCWH